mgnify:CR=1 FL=1
MSNFFKLKENGTNLRTEIISGITLFISVSYILVLNPEILSATGMPRDQLYTVTALVAAISTLLMGWYANQPLAAAPGMGINALFAFGLVQGQGMSVAEALTAALFSGLIFFTLSFLGLRSFLKAAIPNVIKLSCMAGIGIFIAYVGLKNSGVITSNPATFITLGNIAELATAIPLLGLILLGFLLRANNKAAGLITIVTITLASWILGTSEAPNFAALVSMPAMPTDILLNFDFGNIASISFVTAVMSLLFFDLLDTTGTLLGISRASGVRDEEGDIFASRRALQVDAGSTVLSSVLGSSPATVYVESALAPQSGGQTGLVAIVVGILFFVSLFIEPLFSAVPGEASAPVLIAVGAVLMRGASDIKWNRIEHIIPAFFTIVGMALTFSIANGISLGIISYAILNSFPVKSAAADDKVSMQTYILSAVLATYLIVYNSSL